MRALTLMKAPLSMGVVGLWAVAAWATPYGSNVTKTGTTVDFILNETADSLTYSINGGAPQALLPTKGAKSFSLTSPTDTFAIKAEKVAATGYSISTGNQITGTLGAPTNEGG